MWYGILKGRSGQSSYNAPIFSLVYFDRSFSYSYIIDLEDAYDINDDAKPAQFKPSIDWIDWGLAGPTLITNDGVDPMVPCHQFSLVDPGDEALLKMANDAVGKNIYNP